jgi:hypothetical protein
MTSAVRPLARQTVDVRTISSRDDFRPPIAFTDLDHPDLQTNGSAPTRFVGDKIVIKILSLAPISLGAPKSRSLGLLDPLRWHLTLSGSILRSRQTKPPHPLAIVICCETRDKYFRSLW